MLVNPITQKSIKQFVDNPSHALLLVGSQYSGADMLVHSVVDMLKTQHKLTHRQIVPVTSSIPIESVRELRSDEKLKTSRSHGSVASVISIVPIDAMQHEAQNALLKLLEEPPVGTLFILVCHDESRVLNTIVSRCKRVAVLPIAKDQAQQQYGQSELLNQHYLMSGGDALLLDALVKDPNHVVAQSIQNAKKLLSSPLVQKLAAIDGLVKGQKVAETLDALERICKAALQASGNKQAIWAHNLKQTLDAHRMLASNVQSKLVLTNLFCQLKV